MKKVIVAAVLLGLLASALVFSACGGDSVPTGAVATVGDATVTQEQFDQIWKQAEAQYASQEGAPHSPKRVRRSTTSSRRASSTTWCRTRSSSSRRPR